MYDPETGRFLQRDPVWDPGNVGNQYTFCGNNSANCVDPMGEWGDLYGYYRDVKQILKEGVSGFIDGFAAVIKPVRDIPNWVGKKTNEFGKWIGESLSYAKPTPDKLDPSNPSLLTTVSGSNKVFASGRYEESTDFIAAKGHGRRLVYNSYEDFLEKILQHVLEADVPISELTMVGHGCKNGMTFGLDEDGENSYSIAEKTRRFAQKYPGKFVKLRSSFKKGAQIRIHHCSAGFSGVPSVLGAILLGKRGGTVVAYDGYVLTSPLRGLDSNNAGEVKILVPANTSIIPTNREYSVSEKDELKVFLGVRCSTATSNSNRKKTKVSTRKLDIRINLKED